MKNFRMSRIRSKNSKLEIKLRKELWGNGIRYRIHYPVKGKPDIAFPSKKLAVFVDSNFWHGDDWKVLKRKLKDDFWVTKIKKNVARDKMVNKELTILGWKIIRFKENEINNNVVLCVDKIKNLISKN